MFRNHQPQGLEFWYLRAAEYDLLSDDVCVEASLPDAPKRVDVVMIIKLKQL